MNRHAMLVTTVLVLLFASGVAYAVSDFGQPGPGVSCTPIPGEAVTVSDDYGNTYTVGKCSFPGGDPNRVIEIQAP